MSWLTNMMKQIGTYWGSPVPDGRGGWSFAAPTALSPDAGTGVQWQDVNELFIDANGAEQMSKGIIFLSQAVVLNGYLYLGTSVAVDPQVIDGAQRIQRVDKIVNTRNSRTVWKAYL